MSEAIPDEYCIEVLIKATRPYWARIPDSDQDSDERYSIPATVEGAKQVMADYAKLCAIHGEARVRVTRVHRHDVTHDFQGFTRSKS